MKSRVGSLSEGRNPWGRGPEAEAEREQRERDRITSATKAPAKQPEMLSKSPSGHLVMHAEDITLKQASDASRRAGSPADAVPIKLPNIDPDALGKATADWCNSTPEGLAFITGVPEVDQFNVPQLSEAVQHHLRIGWPVSVALIATSYTWARDNNHLDLRRRDEAGNIVSVRGQSTTTPTPCPHCVWPDEEALLAQKAVQHAIADQLAEAARLKKLSTAELKKLALEGRKFPKAGQPGWGGVL